MLIDSQDAEPAKKVTSPGGTTHAAITYLEQKGVPASFIEAIKAAARRSKELAS